MAGPLVLYYRSECSLCDAMHGELLRSPLIDAGRLHRVDIDTDPQLQTRYDHKVPVLADSDGVEICHYFLDQQALEDYFATH